MLKRPSSRRRSNDAQIQLNLVPILDTMVTLIGFLLFTMSFLSLVSIETPFPTASQADVEKKLDEKPLQLTVTFKEDAAEIWSPFEKIPSQSVENLPDDGTGVRKPDFKAIHEALLRVKEKFPNEAQVVIVPHPSLTYDLLISALDSLRVIDPTDPPLFRKNPTTGNDEPIKALFPEVVFGNLLGDA